MEELAACPICNGNKFLSYLSCKDHTVSKRVFTLQQCVGCGLVVTNPRPQKSELGKYYESEAYISHKNKAKGAINQVYRFARTFTLRWKCDLIVEHSINKPTSLLDYGCGTGSFLKECQSKGIAIGGVEPSDIARAEAISLTETQISPDLTGISGKYDVITLWHVLEHVHELNETLESLTSRLNKDGTIFIAVPNLESADARKYREYWAAYDVPRHLWHFSKSSMTKLLDLHKLRVADILPMRLDAYYVSLLSEKYSMKDGGMTSLIRALAQGWKSNRKAKITQDYSSLIYIVRK